MTLPRLLLALAVAVALAYLMVTASPGGDMPATSPDILSY